jgi:membrane-associated phospholipid phosphatase
MARFTLLLSWLRSRLTPLALAFVVIVLSAVCFGLIAEEVHDGDTASIDTSVLVFINGLSSPLLDSVFITITELASAWFVAVIGLILIAELVKRRRLRQATFATVALGGSAALNVILKLLFQRERPELWQRLIHESSFSFPSGHAMASSALASLVIVLLWRTKWRTTAIIVGSIYVVVIGMSRLYLGVHYPTDIIAGWCVSISWVLLSYSVLHARRALWQKKTLMM